MTQSVVQKPYVCPRKQAEPGTEEWLRLVTASKVAAIMKTSPFEAYWTLWKRMHGDLGPSDIDPDIAEYGHLLEPVCAEWWLRHHGDGKLKPGRLCVLRNNRRYAATPDYFVTRDNGDLELIECKTAANRKAWGKPGTDAVPPHIYDQCQWQMFITGAQIVHVPVNFKMQGRFEAYMVLLDPARLEEIISAVSNFVASLEAGEEPSIDPAQGNLDVYEAIRELHPEIDPETVEVDEETAANWIESGELLAAAKENAERAKTMIAAAMGDAQHAQFNGHRVATRQARGTGKPFVVKPKYAPNTKALKTPYRKEQAA